jgi:dynein intermediate chain
LTEEERASIFTAPEFISFLEQSSKIVQRALSDGYDYIRDYTIGADSGTWVVWHFYFNYLTLSSDDSEGKRVKRVCAFWDERWCKNRSITDVDWSPKVFDMKAVIICIEIHSEQYPELNVASYNKNSAALNEPDGLVAVWNLHLLDRPEFVFHSQVSMLYYDV